MRSEYKQAFYTSSILNVYNVEMYAFSLANGRTIKKNTVVTQQTPTACMGILGR